MKKFKNYREAFGCLIGELSGRLDYDTIGLLIKFVEVVRDANRYYRDHAVVEDRPCGRFQVSVECTEIDYEFIISCFMDLKPLKTNIPKCEEVTGQETYKAIGNKHAYYKNTITNIKNQQEEN